jgi:sensor domain CHASE-containing protein
MEHEIEAVARALYAAEDDAQVWEREPEILKAEFRRHARAALELLDQHRSHKLSERAAAHIPHAA